MQRTRLGLLLASGSLLLATACGGQDSLGSSAEGYSYTSEEVPHPGIAEGRPVIKVPQQGTHYACPLLRRDENTPMLTDHCLAPGNLGTTMLEDYSMLEPSLRCSDGGYVTDAGTFGLGFVGDPWLPEDGPSPDLGPALDCIREAFSG